MKKILLLALIFLPVKVFASVSITEIMYDLEGTDTDREWVEVYNDGDAVDLSTWKFFEANTNHGLTLSQGSSVISSGGYAIIAQNPSVFLGDHPSFSGTVLDSSFSLGNETGETLAIKDASLSVIDEVTYSPDQGANGDGNSLSGSGSSWSPSSPTPGSPSTGESSSGENTTTSNTITTVNEDGEVVLMQDSWSTEIKVPEYISIGNSAKFEVTVKDLYFRIVHPGTFVWSMGDGTVYEGEALEEIEHTYYYPGDYVVYVEYYKRGKSTPETFGRRTVVVVDTDISISTILRDGYMIDTKLTNNGSREVNISGWILSSQDKTYTVPKNTIILPKKSLVIPSKNTGFMGGPSAKVVFSSSGLYGSALFSSTNTPTKKFAYAPKTSSTSSSTAQSDVEKSAEKDKNFLTSEVSNKDLTANVSNSGFDKSSLAIFGFIALLFMSGIMTFYIRNQRREVSLEKKDSFSADDFELLE